VCGPHLSKMKVVVIRRRWRPATPSATLRLPFGDPAARFYLLELMLTQAFEPQGMPGTSLEPLD
jgi:hypothetical protein